MPSPSYRFGWNFNPIMFLHQESDGLLVNFETFIKVWIWNLDSRLLEILCRLFFWLFAKIKMLTSTNRCMIKIFFLQIFIIFCQRTADSSREEKQKRHLFNKGKEELLKVLMTYVIKKWNCTHGFSVQGERERERDPKNNSKQLEFHQNTSTRGRHPAGSLCLINSCHQPPGERDWGRT